MNQIAPIALTKAEEDRVNDILYQQVDDIAEELGLKPDPETLRFSEADQEKMIELAASWSFASAPTIDDVQPLLVASCHGI